MILFSALYSARIIYILLCQNIEYRLSFFMKGQAFIVKKYRSLPNKNLRTESSTSAGNVKFSQHGDNVLYFI